MKESKVKESKIKESKVKESKMKESKVKESKVEEMRRVRTTRDALHVSCFSGDRLLPNFQKLRFCSCYFFTGAHSPNWGEGRGWS